MTNQEITNAWILKDFIKIKDLANDHPAIVYLTSLNILENSINDLYYSENYFPFWAKYNNFAKNRNFTYKMNTIRNKNILDNRIIFPIKDLNGLITGLRGHSIYSNSPKSMRNWSKTEQKRVDIENYVKDLDIFFNHENTNYDCSYYGIEKIDFNKTVTVTNNFINTYLIENCVSVCFYSPTCLRRCSSMFNDFILAFDGTLSDLNSIHGFNGFLEGAINMNYKILVSSENIDIINMSKQGHTKNTIKEFINNNIYSGVALKELHNQYRIETAE